MYLMPACSDFFPSQILREHGLGYIYPEGFLFSSSCFSRAAESSCLVTGVKAPHDCQVDGGAD